MPNHLYVTTENILFTATVAFYCIAMILYIAGFAVKKDRISSTAAILLRCAFAFHTLAMIARGIGAGRVPLANQYEFASGFAWGIAVFLIIFEKRYKMHALGVFVSPFAFLILGYAAMQNREIRPLMPALQSTWLVFHVSLAILSYGSFAVACGLSFMHLLKKRKAYENESAGLPELELMDRMSYRAIVLGYLLLTLTIITGALWAQKAWGRYWAWDPKESWSLITWFIYTAYLHMRKVKGMRGSRAAWFAVIGFACVVFTYIGVNTLIPSLHSYR